jgi:uncharacterized membrane protein YphA (DoxX/SURF4 family)
MTMLEYDLYALAIATVRIVLGVLLIFPAYDRLFTVGATSVVSTIISGRKASKLPRSFIVLSVVSSSFIELIGGALLITGFFLPFTYPLLALNFVLVALGFSYLRPVWEMDHYIPRLIMLIFLMVVPVADDIYRLGALF